jgi:hypothetical protein
MIDELIPRNRMHPGCQRFARVVGMTLNMDRQQRLLHKVLRFGSAPSDAREPALVIGSQSAAQSVEQGPMGSGIARQPPTIRFFSSASMADMHYLPLHSQVKPFRLQRRMPKDWARGMPHQSHMGSKAGAMRGARIAAPFTTA